MPLNNFCKNVPNLLNPFFNFSSILSNILDLLPDSVILSDMASAGLGISVVDLLENNPFNLEPIGPNLSNIPENIAFPLFPKNLTIFLPPLIIFKLNKSNIFNGAVSNFPINGNLDNILTLKIIPTP